MNKKETQIILTRIEKWFARLQTLFISNEQNLNELISVASKSVFELSRSSTSATENFFSDDLEQVSRAVAASRVIRFAASNGIFSTSAI